MAGTETPLTVKCPRCSKPVSWTDEFPFKPFCCERCKLIDLGEWAAEEKVIAGEPVSDENENEGKPFYQ